MPIEQELLTLLNNHNEAIQVARSYWQQLANSSYVEEFVRYFYDNLSLAVSSDQRNHLSLTSEIYAAFVSTRISKADYKTFTYETGWVIDKAGRIK